MSCPRTAEVHRSLTEAELNAFVGHAKTCEDCGALIAQVDGAYRVLRSEVAPMSPAKRVEMLAAIEAKTSQPALPWLRIGGVFAAVAAALLVFWLVQTPAPSGPQILSGALAGQTIPFDRVTALPAGTQVEHQGLRITALTDARLSLGPSLTPRALLLETGIVEIDGLAVTPTVRVETPFARITTIAAKFRINVADEEVTRERGEVRVELNGESYPLQTTLSDARAAVLAVKATPEPAAPEPIIEEKVEPTPVPPTPAKKKSRPRPPPAKDRLEEAQKVVRRDAVRARDLAEGVLREKTTPDIEIGALLVLADAHRRTGAWRQAADAYGRVVRHANGDAYAEEALFRRAKILAAHGRSDDALAALRRAAERFPRGSLLPERAVLEARLCLASGDVVGAERAIGRVDGDQTLSVRKMREKVRAAAK